MTIPVTFSAPGDGYEVSDEDCLRDSIVIMLMADDVNRREYSFDDDDPTKGVRISAGIERTDEEGQLIVPQQTVFVGTSSVRVQLEVTRGGAKSITINIGLYEPYGTESLGSDLPTPPITVLAKLARVDAILRKGTLYKEGMTTNDGRVIDRWHSPLNEDGTYDEAQIRVLNRKVPDIVRATPKSIQRRRLTDRELDLPVAPATAFAVLYAVSAAYEIDVPDRESIGQGGFQNDPT